MLGLRSLSLKYTHFAKKALVNSINIFGISPQLTVTKAKKFNTLIGSLFTMLLLVAILILILYDLNDLVLREKPIVIISEGELDINKEYWLKKQNFTFSFGILNKDMIAIEEIERYFSFQVKFCQKNKTTISQNGQQQFIKNCINLETVPCERKHFSKEVYNFFEYVNISNYRCINPNQLEQQKISLLGTIFSNDNNYLTIELSTCQNNQSCYEDNMIQNLLQQAYYSQILPDTQFQWQNSKNLTKQILRNEYSQIFSQQSRIINLQYQIVENQLDSAYAFQDFSYHEYLKIFTLKEEINFNLSDKLIYQEINLNQKLIKNTIQYTKLSTFFSKLGGYIYLFLIVIQFLIYPINKLFYLLDLINKIFRLKIVQDDLNVYQQENDNIIIRSAYFQNLESPNSYCWANVNENLLSQSHKIINFLEKVKNTISITWSQLVQLILGCNSLKKEQIIKIEKKINRKLDIVYIIQKLSEIDKLKFILLNEDQINLFNSLQKPLLLLDQNNTKESRQFFEEDSKKIKLQKGFKSYVNMQDKQQKDATDLKLLSLLDNDLIQLFDQLYHELTFKSFFQDIQLKESKTFKVQKNSKDNSPQQKGIIQKHIKLQTNADQ